MQLKEVLAIVALFFAGFFVLEARHAPSALEARIIKVENSFEIWDLKDQKRKYEKRIEEIEGEYLGKGIIPPDWRHQIEWLSSQIDELKKKIKDLEE